MPGKSASAEREVTNRRPSPLPDTRRSCGAWPARPSEYASESLSSLDWKSGRVDSKCPTRGAPFALAEQAHRHLPLLFSRARGKLKPLESLSHAPAPPLSTTVGRSKLTNTPRSKRLVRSHHHAASRASAVLPILLPPVSSTARCPSPRDTPALRGRRGGRGRGNGLDRLGVKPVIWIPVVAWEPPGRPAARSPAAPDPRRPGRAAG